MWDIHSGEIEVKAKSGTVNKQGTPFPHSPTPTKRWPKSQISLQNFPALFAPPQVQKLSSSPFYPLISAETKLLPFFHTQMQKPTSPPSSYQCFAERNPHRGVEHCSLIQAETMEETTSPVLDNG